MTIWFTSDTHFAHKNTMRYCGRPFLTVEACDEAMINRWNEVVKPEDTVYHLGDVAMHTAPMKRILPKLNGRKILIIGNHDLMYSYFIKTRGQKFVERMYKEYKDAGFSLILESGSKFSFYVTAATGRGHMNVRLSHFPTRNAEDRYHNDKHDKARPTDDGMLNICGHVHQNWLKRGNNINVGVDVWDFRPVSLQDVVNLYVSGPENVDAPHPIRIKLWTLFHTACWYYRRLTDKNLRQQIAERKKMGKRIK